MKLKHTCFCFHPRFDTATWSIAVAFTTLVLSSALFFAALSYSFPKCFCPQIWEHLTILPAAFQVIYVLVLLHFATLCLVSCLAIYGSFKAEQNKFPPYLVMMTCTEIATFAISIFVFVQLARFEEYLLFDNDTYWNMAKMVLKEDLITNLEAIIELMSNLLKQLLNIDMAETLNLDTLMDAALKEEVLIVLGGMKIMMKASASILLVGINALFITSILIVASHYMRLRKGTVKPYTGVQAMVLNRPKLSNSARSTESETLSDWSGVPLKQIKRMKSKDYNCSNRSSRRIYDVRKLEVEEKFPRGGFL